MLPPPFISTFSPKYTRYLTALAESTTIGTSTMTANRALYYPLVIPFPYPIKRFWIYNSTVAGNIDIGIYTREGTKVVSTGSVVQAGASVMQYISSSYLLSPGSYYLALASSSTGGTQTQSFGQNMARATGILQQTGAFPLPATMTPEVPAETFMRLFGFTLTESGF
jgi:hypothetical protein